MSDSPPARVEQAVAAAVAGAIRMRVVSPLHLVASLLLQIDTPPPSSDDAYIRANDIQRALEVAFAQLERREEDNVPEALAAIARSLLLSSSHHQLLKAEAGLACLKREIRASEEAHALELSAVRAHAEKAVKKAHRAELVRWRARHARLLKLCHDLCPDVLTIFSQGSTLSAPLSRGQTDGPGVAREDKRLPGGLSIAFGRAVTPTSSRTSSPHTNCSPDTRADLRARRGFPRSPEGSSRLSHARHGEVSPRQHSQVASLLSLCTLHEKLLLARV